LHVCFPQPLHSGEEFTIRTVNVVLPTENVLEVLSATPCDEAISRCA
jgi:hypothetical protein